MNQSLTAQLEKCECCPRRCGVNRLEDETGFCGVGSGIEISHAGLHFGEEPLFPAQEVRAPFFLAGAISAACFARITRSARNFSRAAPGL